MVNWSDPQEIAKDSETFKNLVFALFGCYLWELFCTSDFEISLITRRRRFRWPLVFFFLCRYCMIFAFIGILSFAVTSKINCGILYTFNSWAGNTTILCASTSLMLRTIAIWDRNLKVIVPISILSLGHWCVLIRGMFIVKSGWNGTACVVVATNPALLRLTFLFTMGFDLTILCATSVALLRHSAHTTLWKLLFTDGLVFFVVSFTANCIPAVFNILDLNPIMNVIATVPAAAISSIAACRAVIRLQEYALSDSNVYIHSLGGSQLSRFKATRQEVHVKTEQITMSEFTPSERESPSSPQFKKTSITDSFNASQKECASAV